MKAIQKIILISAFIVSTTTFASEQNEVKNISGIPIPLTISEFEVKKEINNEIVKKGLGHTFHYNAPSVKVSLYVYNLNYNSIPQGIESSIVKEHFLQINNDVICYNPTAQQIIDNETLFISGIPVLHAVFFYSEKKAGSTLPVFSHTYLTSLKNQFIKLRISYLAENGPKEGHAKHVLFVDELFKYIAEKTIQIN